MKIDSSNILMSSSSLLTKSYKSKESLKFWTGDTRPDFEGPRQVATRTLKDLLPSISEQARKIRKTSKPNDDDYSELSDPQKALVKLLEALIEKLTGKKVHLKVIGMPDQGGDVQIGAQKAGWGLEYDKTETYHEKETMTFNASGVVRTGDGREIKFDASLSMNREFMVSNSISLRAGDAKLVDPLIINFDGNAPGLTDGKYAFDINSDGRQEKVSFAGPGSGFLALDRNKDGRVNDGAELFGPATGSGFGELAQYDSNKDGWIDESDPVYNDLKIWSKDQNGSDTLSTLNDKNIGALYLANIPAQFSFTDSGNSSAGESKSAGIYLKEDGSAGTMQHLDLVA